MYENFHFCKRTAECICDHSGLHENTGSFQFKEVVKNRYSCKKYSDRQVEPEKLTAILEAGRLAPTAKNLQEQHIYVIQSAEKLSVIDKLTPCRYGAPTVLAVAFDRNNVFTYPGEKRDSGVEDAAIVATHLTLAAPQRAQVRCRTTPAGSLCQRRSHICKIQDMMEK